MALEPFFMGEVHDIKVVPTSITYEKVLEEQLFVYELLGVPKPKESTLGFFKAVKGLMDNNYGNMYFDFCEPISLNDFFGDKVDKFRHASEPAHIQKLNSEELVLTTDFAHHVVQEQQKKIVICTYNLIALIYNQHVFDGTVESLSMAVLQQEIERYAELFESLGAIVAVDSKNLVMAIRNTMSTHENILETFGADVLIRLKKVNTLATRRENGAKLKGHWLCKELMDIAVPVFSLQLYCNPTLFWLSQPAIFVLSLIGQHNVPIEQLKKDVSMLRNVFIYELVLYPRFADKEFSSMLEILQMLQVIKLLPDETVSLNTQSPHVIVLLSAISPFLNCYLNASNIILQSFVEKKFSSKDVFIAVQSSLEQEILRGNFSIHPYSLCLEAVTTTILSLCNNSCLFKEKQ
jgi:glycerone phosphate O-acyltransferase